MELRSYDNSNEYEMFKRISRACTYVLTPSECNER